MIGAFVVGAIALAVAAVLILAGDQLFRQDRSSYVMYFHGSVKGLNVGSPVMFRGVNIGTVTSIQLVVAEDNIRVDIPVIVEVDHTRFIHIQPEGLESETEDDDINQLIQAGLRAQLQLQSLLTGQLLIQLDFQPHTPIDLVGDEMYRSKYAEIPTIPTPSEKLSELLHDFPFEKVMKHIIAATEGVDKLVNSPLLNESLASLRDTLTELESLVDKADAAFGPLASEANDTLQDTRVALKNINAAVDDAGAALRQAEKTFKSADTLVSNDQLMTQIEQTLTAFTNAARSIQILAETLERRPESMIRGRR
jgi:paraquat-inducible protein B